MPVKGLVHFLIFITIFFQFSCRHSEGLFSSLSPSKTNIDFSNTLEKRDLFGILYYLYYYNGGGVQPAISITTACRIFILRPTAKAIINFT